MKAVFLDRDGTLIHDVHYLSSPDQIVLVEPMVDVCRALQDAGYLIVIVTNQSGVARGMFPEERVHEVHDRLTEMLSVHGVVVANYFYCPHHPSAGDNPAYTRVCACRKPAPGMLLRAADELGIDLAQSMMIGDKECDVQAGAAAGCISFFVQDIVKDAAGWLQQNVC